MKKSYSNDISTEKSEFEIINGFKVIEVNVSDSTENLPALVNPVKINL